MSIIPTQAVGAIDKTVRVAHWLDVQSGAQPESFYSSEEVKENLRQALKEKSISARRELGKGISRLPPVRASDLRGLYSSMLGEGKSRFSSLRCVPVVFSREGDSESIRASPVEPRELGVFVFPIWGRGRRNRGSPDRLSRCESPNGRCGCGRQTIQVITMSSEATQNNGSMANTNNDDDLNVFVAALGLTGNDRYVRDMEALADRAESGIKKIAAMADQRVDNVVVRENFALSQVLEERFDADVFPSVEYYSMDWRMFLDDPAEEGDNYSVAGVMTGDDVPVGELMAEEHGVDASSFDLSDREDRNDIDYSLLEQSRINRAKAKARGKTDERVYNDYFDSVTTASHAVFLHDGTDRGMEAITTARGTNPWVKYATALSGDYVDVSANKDDDQILDWARYLVETSRSDVEADDLTDGQVADLRARLSPDDLEYLGLEPQAAPKNEPEPEAGAAASEVTPAKAD